MILGFLTVMSFAFFAVALPSDGLILKLNSDEIETSFWGTDTVVSKWVDQSGRANNFVQTNNDNSKMPLVNSAALNGYDTVKFRTTDQLRVAAAAAGDFNPGNGGMTIVMVMKVDSLSGTRYVLRKGNYSSSFHPGWSIWTDATRLIIRLANTENVNLADNKAGLTQTITGRVQQWFIYSVVIGSNESDIEQFMPLTAHLDNIAASTNVWDNAALKGTISSPDSVFLNVGSDVEFAEILVYSRPLETEEIGTVGSYLSKKYDLTTSYPVIDDCRYLWLDEGGMAEDLNQDCRVDLQDLAYMAAHWGEIYDPAAE